LSLIYKVKSDFSTLFSDVVPHTGETNNTPDALNIPPALNDDMWKALEECKKFAAELKEPAPIKPLWENQFSSRA
jgi:hypothetical protein